MGILNELSFYSPVNDFVKASPQRLPFCQYLKLPNMYSVVKEGSGRKTLLYWVKSNFLNIILILAGNF